MKKTDNRHKASALLALFVTCIIAILTIGAKADSGILIPGSYAKAIIVAWQAAEKDSYALPGRPLDSYSIYVSDNASEYSVSFSWSDTIERPNGAGPLTSHGGFEYKLDKESFKVLHKYILE